jgi:type IV secretory pathway VirB3-like protein
MNNGHNQPQPRSNWRELWDACTRTWQRAFLTLGIIVFLAASGIITGTINLIIGNVLVPIAVLLVIVWVIKTLAPSGRRH